MRSTPDAPAVDDPADSADTYLDTDLPAAPEAPRVPSQPGPGDEAFLDGPLVPAQRAPAESGLTTRERQVLAFERRWWRHAGSKEQAIRDSFDLSSTRYYQILNGLLDNPAAIAADPVLIGRLRRLRAAQIRARRR